MQVPTIQQIDKIIEKIRGYTQRVSDAYEEPNRSRLVSERLSVFVGCEFEYCWPPLERFIQKLGGMDVRLDREPQGAKEVTRALLLSTGSAEQIKEYLMKWASSGTYRELCRLQKNEIVPLLRDALAHANQEPGRTSGQPSTPREVQLLVDLCNAVDKRIASLVEQAEEEDLRDRTQNTGGEIEEMLLPFADYIRLATGGRRGEEPDVLRLIRLGNVFACADAIPELEKVKCRLLSEADQQRLQPVEREAGKTGKTPPVCSQRRFQPWGQPRDACFVVDQNGRLHFHYDGRIVDLCLKSGSSALDLMKALTVGSLSQDEVKMHCSKGTKPSNTVSRINATLNERIAAKGFVGIPPNIEFIGRNEKTRCYGCRLPLYPSMDDFEHAQAEGILRGD